MSSKVLILFFIMLNFLHAQKDTVKNYNLSEITIQSGVLIHSKPLTELSYNSLRNLNPSSLYNLFFSLPSIKTQNNSRGESLIYFRGSGKRQLTLFFDGVPLNIPWDNRIDLSLLPTDALESVEIIKGIPSVVYGANTIAGVVNVFSLKPKNKNKGNFSFQLGENNYQKYSGFWHDNIGKINYLLSLSYFNADGFYLPSDFNNKRKVRTNSNIQSFNGLVKLYYNYGHASNISGLFSFDDSKKSVPPELDVIKPRFWKYPVWQRFSTIVTGTQKFTNGSNISYSFSATKLNRQIDQYKTNKYLEIDDVEKGEDITLYAKMLYTKIFSSSSIIKFVASALSSKHIEKIKSENFNKIKYSQNTFSNGLEYEYLNNQFSAIAGISLDMQSMPLTGDKPARDMLLDIGGNLTFSYPVFTGIRSQISFGKKTRFPTLRELFSGALGRFIPNPNLKAEKAYSAEINFSSETFGANNQLNFFLSYLKDGIVRTSLPNKKFMRINKTKIRSYGIEFTSDFKLQKKLNAIVGLSYLNSFAENTDGEFVDTLEYKPSYIFNTKLNYGCCKNIKTFLEANFIGEEFGIKKGEKGFKRLDSYLIVNFKISYLINIKNIRNFNLYLRINNIFDKLYYTQWGLPEAGRQFFVGTSLTF